MNAMSGSNNNQEQNGVLPLEQSVLVLSETNGDKENWNSLQVQVAIVFLEALMRLVLSPDVVSMAIIVTRANCKRLGLSEDESNQALLWLLERFEERRLSNPLSCMF